jgi:hypothetical protein
MGKKTALRRLSKLLPLSTTAANAFRVSELHEELQRPSQVIDGNVVSDEPPTNEETVVETKPKRRRSALDDLPQDTAQHSTARQSAAVGGDRPDLRVDPETGRILDEDEVLGDDDGQTEG